MIFIREQILWARRDLIENEKGFSNFAPDFIAILIHPLTCVQRAPLTTPRRYITRSLSYSELRQGKEINTTKKCYFDKFEGIKTIEKVSRKWSCHCHYHHHERYTRDHDRTHNKSKVSNHSVWLCRIMCSRDRLYISFLAINFDNASAVAALY